MTYEETVQIKNEVMEDMAFAAQNRDVIRDLRKLRSFHNGRYGKSTNAAIDAIEKLAKIRYLVENYPIRIDHYDFEHGNRDFVLGCESVRESILDILNEDNTK